MKAIILGAGQVGTTLAEHLAAEKNDVSLIDNSAERLEPLRERLDIQTIEGNASHPSILHQAGAETADLLIAVTSQDEINMVACQVAFTLFQIPNKIARIRSLSFLAHRELFGSKAIPIDVLISPEQVITNHIKRMIERPDALQIIDFASQQIQTVAVRILEDSPIIGQELTHLTIARNIPFRIIAVFRKDVAIIPKTKSITIEPGDEIVFICAKSNTPDIMKFMGHSEKPNRKILIAGGGNIGTRLTLGLESNHKIKVIERNPKRAELLANFTNDAVVLLGECSDKELLQQEGVDHTDIYCAVTSSDEDNIISCMLAKKLGAKKVMALINKVPYLEIIRGSDVDIAISSNHATIASLLTHIRGGHVVNAYALRRGIAEAMETLVGTEKSSSKIIGKKISELKIPDKVILGAIKRSDSVILKFDDITVQPKDHLVWIIYDRQKLSEVESLLQRDD